MDREAWWATVLGVAKSQDMTEYTHMHAQYSVMSAVTLKGRVKRYREVTEECGVLGKIHCNCD